MDLDFREEHEVLVSEDKALGLAMCKGVNRGRPDQHFTSLCHRSAMCPSCERVKSGRKAHGYRPEGSQHLMKRLMVILSAVF